MPTTSAKKPNGDYSACGDRKVEHVQIAALQPHQNNARTHSKRQIQQIAASIERFGFTNPILIDDSNRIICGHGRVAAARLLGHDSVPSLKIDHLTDVEKRAYILADNKLAELSGWDREILAIELQALVEVEFDLDVIGFETAEIDSIFDEASGLQDTSPGDEPVTYDKTNAITQAGDLWHLGEHRLVCGDARDETTYVKLLGQERAEFVFTDPPYNLPIDGHVSGLGRIRHKDFAMGCGELSAEQFTDLLRTTFGHMATYSRSGAIHQICMDWRHMGEMLAAGKSVYSELKNLCVWNKSNAGMGTFYRSKHELVFVWKNGSAPHINNFQLGQHGRHRANVWDYPGVGREEQASHPTVKPVALVADAIKDCSRRNGIVLDPFAGSGTILIAAESTSRKARAAEIDPHYCDVAIRRWQTYSGNEAIHGETNQTFDNRMAQSQNAEAVE